MADRGGGAARARRRAEPADDGAPGTRGADAEASQRARAGEATPALAGIRGGAAGHAPSLDQLIHERVRLGIVSALAVNDALAHNELKALLGTSDGNLSVHARRLEEGGYVACRKTFEGRTPRTEYQLTDAGRQALARYLDHMEALIRATRAPTMR